MTTEETAPALQAPQPAFVTQSFARGRRSRTGDRIAETLIASAAVLSGSFVLLVIAFVFWYAAPLFADQGWPFVSTGGWDGQIEEAWEMVRVTFGALPLLAGTLLSTTGALIVSTVIGLGCAIFIAELSPKSLRRPFETLIQLLAGIPSVVFGLVGLVAVVPFLTRFVPADSFEAVADVPLDGASLLAAVIVLSFMILPFFVTVAVDSLRAVPRSYMAGGMALGMRRWRAIVRLQVPAAIPGLLAGIVLASARAVGEAIALSMVAGSIAYVPTLEYGLKYFPFMPIRTLASAIVETGGEAISIPAIQAALFGLAALLLLFSLALSVSARVMVAWLSKRMRLDTGRSL